MPRLGVPVVALVVAVLAAGSASATVYYVRTDGHDSNCTGRSDAAYSGSGSGQACAFRTVGKGETAASCGDTVYVRAGKYFETGTLTINDNCTEGTQKKIIGDGSSQVTLFTSSAGEITGCTRKSGKTHVYECPVPSSGDTGLSTGGKFYQKLTNHIDLESKAGQVTTSHTDYFKLTPSVDATCDSNGATTGGTGNDFDLSVCRGMYTYNATSGKYEIRPWNDEAPSGTTKFYAASTTGGSWAVLMDGADWLTFKGMTVIVGSGQFLRIFGTSTDTKNNTVEDVVAYGGGMWVYGPTYTSTATTGNRILDVAILNLLGRAQNYGCGQIGNGCPSTAEWGPSDTACVIRGWGTTVDGLRCYGGRQGLLFGGGNLSVRNVRSHGFNNHGCQFNDPLVNSTFENMLCHGNQEGMHWANCQRDVTLRHVTVIGTWFLQDHYGAAGQDECFDDGTGRTRGQWGIKVFNSSLDRVIWKNVYANGGDPRSGARGHQFDYNTYNQSVRRVMHFPTAGGASIDFDSVVDWQNYTRDTCTNCIRDPNSVDSLKHLEYVNYPESGATNCETIACGYDYHLKATAAVVNLGSVTHTSTTDFDGFTRDSAPDAGAYEYVNCGNGVIEGSEQCDAANLGGATCESVGYGAGTLACSSECRYDVTGCSPPPAPPAPDSVRRTDQKAG